MLLSRPTGSWPVLSAPARGILFSLLTDGPASRAELAATHGLSKSTLTRLTRELADHDLITEGATELRRSTGRPSEMLEPAASAAHFAGIKLTGDTAFGAVTDLMGRVVDTAEHRLTSTEPAQVVEQIAAMVERMRSVHDVTGVGITLAGTVLDNGELIVESDFLHWHDERLTSRVVELTGLPTIADNDVQALTAAEHWFGDGEHLDSLAVVTVGAGVGCGIVANGRLVEGAHGLPGQVAHLPVDRSGPICRQGHRGCVSAYLATDGIVRGVSAALGTPVEYADALASASAGDPATLRVFADAGYALGHVVGLVASLADPERVIVTGDGLAVWSLAQPAIREGVRSTFRGTPEDVRVDSVPFEFSEWARAAAVLAIRHAVGGHRV